MKRILNVAFALGIRSLPAAPMQDAVWVKIGQTITGVETISEIEADTKPLRAGVLQSPVFFGQRHFMGFAVSEAHRNALAANSSEGMSIPCKLVTGESRPFSVQFARGRIETVSAEK